VTLPNDANDQHHLQVTTLSSDAFLHITLFLYGFIKVLEPYTAFVNSTYRAPEQLIEPNGIFHAVDM
jgi:hypothetical protein